MKNLVSRIVYWLCAAMFLPLFVAVHMSTHANETLRAGNLYLWGDAKGLVLALSALPFYSLVPIIDGVTNSQQQSKPRIAKVLLANLALSAVTVVLAIALSGIVSALYILPLLVSQAFGSLVALPLIKRSKPVLDFGVPVFRKTALTDWQDHGRRAVALVFTGLWLFLVYEDVSENGFGILVYCLAALGGWGIGKVFWDTGNRIVK
ncbi:hypothetical protein PQU92_01600 [Asticcacaulis sp. BYS171W]|uniref:Uncharacterized protein n=1 Tax=Asticcacaulis aquaticus TaxID=2984212 RepID=A0ABT5HPS9_9CAUL|nr:hypothetical protein [Asticcacaulis aquaticus]MDC7681952.1 hypothetical protein [Asticcacaulis aquaticus]